MAKADKIMMIVRHSDIPAMVTVLSHILDSVCDVIGIVPNTTEAFSTKTKMLKKTCKLRAESITFIDAIWVCMASSILF